MPLIPGQYRGTYFNGTFGDNPIERFFGGTNAGTPSYTQPKPKIAGTGYEANPNNAGPAGGLGFDQDIQRVTDRILQSIDQGNKFNIDQRNQAIAGLLGPGGLQSKVSGYFSGAQTATENALPLNPFSDAIRQSLMHQANDQITTQTQDYLRKASEDLASRGLSSGGSTGQTAAGGVFSGSLRDRVDTNIGLNKAQMEFNTQSNDQRQAIINDLIDKRASMESQIGSLAAGIQSGNVIDPNRTADELGGAFGLQISRENQQQMMDWIKAQKPTFLQNLVKTLPLILTGFNPSMQGMQALTTALTSSIPQGSY